MRYRVQLLLVTITAAALYTVLFSEPTGSELIIETDWITVPASAALQPDAVAAIPFRTEGTFGYLDHDGNLAYRGRLTHGAAIGPEHFISFPASPPQLVVQGSDGRFVASIDGDAYPHVEANRLFTFSSDGTEVVEWSFGGEQLWRTHLAAPVAAFAAGPEIVAVGLATGGLKLYGPGGELLRLDSAPGVETGIIYGLHVDQLDATVALLSGPGESTVALLEPRDLRYVSVFRRAVDAAWGRSTVVAEVANEHIVFGTDDGIEIVDITTGDVRSVDLAGVATALYEVPELGLIGVVSVGVDRVPSLAFRRRVELLWTTYEGTVLAVDTFAANQVRVDPDGPTVRISTDDRVLQLWIGEG